MRMTKEMAERIKHSPEWEALAKEIDYRIELLLNRMKTCQTSELPIWQAHIQMWERIRKLPQDVIDRESE